jgi:hypothetical protein
VATQFNFTLNTAEVENMYRCVHARTCDVYVEIRKEMIGENRPEVIERLESKLAYMTRLEDRIFDGQEHVENSKDFDI